MKFGLGARVKHPRFDIGLVSGGTLDPKRIFIKHEGEKEIADDFAGLELLEEPPQPYQGPSLIEVKEALRAVLHEMLDESEAVPIAYKWWGGHLILKPANPVLQSKEIPIQVFFHKIAMLRDRLRVLEQKINSHEKLEEDE